MGRKRKKTNNEIKLTEIPISDRHKTGSSISKLDILETYEVKELVTQSEKKKVEKENLSLDDVDKRILTIDDFLDEVEKS